MAGSEKNRQIAENYLQEYLRDRKSNTISTVLINEHTGTRSVSDDDIKDILKDMGWQSARHGEIFVRVTEDAATLDGRNATYIPTKSPPNKDKDFLSNSDGIRYKGYDRGLNPVDEF